MCAMSHSFTSEVYTTILPTILLNKPKKWLAYAFASYCDYAESARLSIRKLSALPKETLVNACMEAIIDVNACSNDFDEIYIDAEGWYSVSLSEYDSMTDKQKDVLDGYY